MKKRFQIQFHKTLNHTGWTSFDKESVFKKIFQSQLRINMVSGTLLTAVNAASIVIAYPIYLHFLGYEGYGVWIVLSTVLSFAQLGNIGIDQAVMKLVAKEYGRGNVERIQKYITTALALLCLSGAAVLLVILFFREHIISAFRLSDKNTQIVFLLLPYIGVLSIYVFIVQVLNAALSGLGRMDLANCTQSIGRIIAVIVSALLLYSGLGIECLIIGNAISYVFIHFASLCFIWRIIPVRLLRISNMDTCCVGRLVRFGGGILAGTVVSMLGSPFNKLMLSRYAGISTLPIYEMAFNGAMQLRNLIEAGFRALMPVSSRLNAVITSNVVESINRIHRLSFNIIIFFGIPLFSIMFIFATPLFQIWLREDFIGAAPFVFRIMLIATFINLLGVPQFYILMGMGHIQDVFIGRSITWLACMTLVLFISVSIDYLSVSIIGVCLIISWSLSSTYLTWRFNCAFIKSQR
jgi:O-antigen/teichoic acid export membrane protein